MSRAACAPTRRRRTRRASSAAVAARDEALLDLIGDAWVGVHHSTGAVYDWPRNFVALESALGAVSPR